MFEGVEFGVLHHKAWGLGVGVGPVKKVYGFREASPLPEPYAHTDYTLETRNLKPLTCNPQRHFGDAG